MTNFAFSLSRYRNGPDIHLFCEIPHHPEFLADVIRRCNPEHLKIAGLCTSRVVLETDFALDALYIEGRYRHFFPFAEAWIIEDVLAEEGALA